MAKLSRKTQLTTGGPVFVYVDEDKHKIIRMTPIDLTEEDAASWKVEARGKVSKVGYYTKEFKS